MIYKKSTSSVASYDAYYDFPDVINDYEEIDEGEYVLEHDKTTTFLPFESSTPGNGKPGHKLSEPGVYDYLDYELSPRIEGSSSASNIIANKLECLKNLKRTKIFVFSIIAILITAAIAIGVVFHHQRKNCLNAATDCQSELNNAKDNGNWESFNRRCKERGNSNSFGNRCDICCRNHNRVLKMINKQNLKEAGTKTDKPEKIFKCEDCDATFRAKGIMQSHAKAIHKKIRDFSCNFCEYTSALKGGITNHMNGTHNKVEAYQCTFCLKIINRKWDLGKHLKADHKDVINL